MENQALLPLVAEWLKETTLPDMTLRILLRPWDPRRQTRIMAVLGPRRAGKTYLLFQAIRKLLESGVKRSEILFVDFEDYRLKGFKPRDMEALFEAFERLAGKRPRYLFFDEIHQLPDWSRVLRTLHNSRRYVLTVTGSNSALLTGEVASELRGRYEDMLLLPFSFPEYLAFRKIPWDRALLHTPARGRVVGAFSDYVAGGGFPEVCRQDTAAEKRRLLKNYYDTVFYRDILERHQVRSRLDLDKLMGVLLEAPGELFSISGFERRSRQEGTAPSKRTISNHLEYLREAYFVLTTEKFDYSARKRAANPRKAYLFDTGFGLLTPRFSENRGKWLENAAAIHWFRQERIFYYYKGRRECDFVVLKGSKPAEVWQACWEIHSSNEKRETEGLAEAMSELGVKHGGIITLEQEGIRKVGGRKVPVIPLWKKILLDPDSQ